MSEQDVPVAVVTGAGRGIGEAVAGRLVAEGWYVVAIDRDAAGIGEFVRRVGPGRAEAAVVDVTDRAAVHDLFAQLDRRLRRIDAVVNNAMWVHYAPIADMTEEVLDGIFAIGLKAAFWTVQAARPIMARQNDGVVINMSSPAATRGVPGKRSQASDLDRRRSHRPAHPRRRCATVLALRTRR